MSAEGDIVQEWGISGNSITKNLGASKSGRNGLKFQGIPRNSKEVRWVLGNEIRDDKELLPCVCCGNILDPNLSPMPKIPDFGNTTGFFLNTENEAPDLSFSRVLMEF